MPKGFLVNLFINLRKNLLKFKKMTFDPWTGGSRSNDDAYYENDGGGSNNGGGVSFLILLMIAISSGMGCVVFHKDILSAIIYFLLFLISIVTFTLMVWEYITKK
ncbi:MAG: hypothetical protein CVT89_07715 [Candidatus Altiarchaeales archaeon HGW-Altiarchaeales-2]|nr:MAG: hypothetical protein CVT89_07715 [Candidatus Altiarchaeales archaeon HGW-Altiarchaeales-2]